MALMGFSDENGYVREVSVFDPMPVATWPGGRGVYKTVALDGSSGNGTTGAINLFTVTGNMVVRLVAYCTEDLVSAGGGTIEVGVASNTAGIIAQTTATNLDNNEIWYNATPVAGVTNITNIAQFVVVNGADIILTIGTATITDGTIQFALYFQPLDATSAAVAA